MKDYHMDYQDYQVLACFGRRHAKEANEERLQELYPKGVWWITADCNHEFRVYRQVTNEQQEKRLEEPTLKEIRQESANRMCLTAWKYI
tara:strand:+ start:241 stop:507 length:267 start_codon:yes stop_codon:yes gene_type:complete